MMKEMKCQLVNSEDKYSVLGEASKADLIEMVDLLKRREINSTEEMKREQQEMLTESLKNTAVSLIVQSRAEDIKQV